MALLKCKVWWQNPGKLHSNCFVVELDQQLFYILTQFQEFKQNILLVKLWWLKNVADTMWEQCIFGWTATAETALQQRMSLTD